MPARNRARVCTLGTQEDMIRLCRALLDNCQWFEAPEEQNRELTLDQLIALVNTHAQLEGGREGSFAYAMVAPHPDGDAVASTCRLSIRKHPTGLYLALFCYDSESLFQHEDWLSLHRQVKMLPMMALYANDDFGREKGLKTFISGRAGDAWEHMGEVFFFLIAQYEEGYPPEEAVMRLMKLRETLEREEFDLTMGELLANCIAHLTALDAQTCDTAALTADMQQMRAVKDYDGLFHLYLLLIEAELWDIEHVDRHLACLQSLNTAWQAVEADAPAQEEAQTPQE